MEVNKDQSISKTTITGVNIIYLLSMLLFITIGAYAQGRSFNIGIIVTEVLLIALPALLYILSRRGSIKRELRFNRLHFIDAVLVIMIFFCGYPVALFINLIPNIILSLFGKLIPSPIPNASNIKEYFILLLIVAGSAGLCEEILFRGLIMRGYQKLGMWKSIIFTATLFAMLHMNIQNILGPLFLGILLGYVVFTTNSIYAGMLGHFFNNAISVSIIFLGTQLKLLNNSVVQNIPAGAETTGLIFGTVIMGFVAVLPAILLVFCMKSLKELNADRVGIMQEDDIALERLKLRNIIRSLRISWPIYISIIIFCFYSVVELTYVVTGRSILDMIF